MLFLSGMGRRGLSGQVAVFSNIMAYLAAFTTPYPYAPSADVTTGSWGEAPLFSKLNESTPDDSTYVTYTSGNPTFEVLLSGYSAPPTTSLHIVKVRAKNVSASSITVELYQGLRRVGTWTHALSTAYKTYEDVLTPNQVGLISDYTDLRIRVTGSTEGDCVSYAGFELDDNQRMTVPEDVKGSIDPISIRLDGYTSNSFRTTLTNPTVVSPSAYDSLQLQVGSILQSTSTGLQKLYTGPFELTDTDGTNSIPLAISLSVFKGRQSTLTMKLDQDMLYADTTTLPAVPVFDVTTFKDLNYDATENAVLSYLSDYVAFDISAIAAANRPTLSNGPIATMVMFSGDGAAISGAPRPLTDANKTPNFEIVNPMYIENGLIRTPQDFGSGPKAPGTYTVLEPDPRDVMNTGLTITSLAGYWRPYTDVLSNMGDFVMVAFPNSRGTTTQQLVAFRRNGSGAITLMYAGTIAYTATGGTIRLAPIQQLGSSNPTGVVTGTASNLTKVGSIVMDGDFTLNAPPAGMASTGTFVVFRR